MFSLQPSDELVFGSSTASKGYEIHQDLNMDDALPQTNFINFCTERVTSRTTNSELTHERESNSISRRVLHREIERKRRKQMGDLHLTLASLLPIQTLKGKGVVCDQLQEAANYIKKMKSNIEELKIRRDRLAKLSENNREKVVSDDECVNITINPLPEGMEILIKSLHFGASPALEELAEREQLDVVNYVSTRTNAGFLHKIHVQAKDVRSLDVSVLQHKLSNAMKILALGEPPSPTYDHFARL